MESSDARIRHVRDVPDRDRWMAEVFASTSDAIFVVGESGKIAFANQKASELSGWNAIEVIGKSVGDVVRFSIDDEVRTILSSSPYIPAKSPQEFSGRISIIKKDGTNNPITGREIPFFDDRNERLGTLIFLRDATAEHRLVQAKDHFISIVAHQLRTPLGSARWCMDMLLSGDLGELSGKAREAIVSLHASNQQMIELVNDLLDTEKFNRTRGIEKIVDVDIPEVIDGIFRFLELDAQRRRVLLGKQCDVSIPRISVPRRRFYEVLRNLISNAVKYSKPGGRVSVETHEVGHERYLISIRDEGIGIPIDEQANIFSKFFRASNAIRTHAEGSGLGLATVKFFVEAWGGRVWFESQEGRGTTFFVELPIVSSHETMNRVDVPPVGV